MMKKFDFAAKYKNKDKKDRIKGGAIFMLACGVCPMALAATYCGLYWSMWA